MVHGDSVKAVAVHDEVVTFFAGMDVFVDDLQIAEKKRQEFGQNVVVITAQVDDFGASLFDLLENETDETGMLVSPASAAGETPAVDDVTIEHEFFAVGVLEEVVYLINFAIEGSQVDIRQENCLVGKCGLFHVSIGF